MIVLINVIDCANDYTNKINVLIDVHICTC